MGSCLQSCLVSCLCVGKKGNGCACNLPVIQNIKQARRSGKKRAFGLINFFTNRSPDDASVKSKMIFASSKDALRRRLEGA